MTRLARYEFPGHLRVAPVSLAAVPFHARQEGQVLLDDSSVIDVSRRLLVRDRAPPSSPSRRVRLPDRRLVLIESFVLRSREGKPDGWSTAVGSSRETIEARVRGKRRDTGGEIYCDLDRSAREEVARRSAEVQGEEEGV